MARNDKIICMTKFVPQWIYAMTLLLLCTCSAASPPKPSEPSNIPSNIPNNRSIGCGIPQKGTDSFVTSKINVRNQDRIYHLRIPSSYDSNRAYPIIFRWHGAGGNGLSGGLNIEYSAGNDAIIVSADGLNSFWQVHTNSFDLRLFDSLLETISSQYCIDNKRIFSYGFSNGGSFSNLLACERSDMLRASAAIASGLFSINCKGKVATWLLHDADDDAVPIAKGKAARDRALASNGCSNSTIDEGNGCVRYAGCDAAPVVWCESKGFGHNIRGDYAPAKVWQFFQSFH
jgi:polyhydroxybutyrate depolymerase